MRLGIGQSNHIKDFENMYIILKCLFVQVHTEVGYVKQGDGL